MHAAPHAEWHVLEVCKFETPAVFMSASVPRCTHAYAGLDKISNETKRFDKRPQHASRSTALLLMNTRLVYNSLTNGSFPAYTDMLVTKLVMNDVAECADDSPTIADFQA